MYYCGQSPGVCKRCVMKESRIKKYKMIIWVPILVVVLGTCLLTPLVHGAYYEHKQHSREVTLLNAETYSERMLGELNKGLSATNTLEQILISEKGQINDFDTIAKNLMTDYIRCIELAPGGTVRDVYPKSEQVNLNVFENADSADIANYSRDSGEIAAQGPFTLAQGDDAIVIRNPVYITKEDGTSQSQEFWGFTIVVIKVPKIFENSVEALTGFGYNYRLEVKSKITADNWHGVCCSGVELTDPLSKTFEFGCNEWKLEVMPAASLNSNNALVVCIVGGVIIIMLAALTMSTLILAQRHNKYKRLAVTDVLTDLLNRGGFENEFDRYHNEHADEPCVEAILDIDDFKKMNDIYGHAVGDEVLKHLAADLRSAFDNDAIIARSGGDEFNIILKNRTADGAKADLEDFTFAPHTFWLNGKKYNYTVSLGYAEYPKQASARAELANKSDIALYEAKLHGKHNCYAYSDELSIEKRARLGFALNDISKNLPCAFLIYKADINNDTMLFANNEMIKLAGCTDIDDFMRFCGRRFGNLLHPDDKSRVEESIWAQINSKRDGSNDYVKFRLATKSGEYKSVLDHGRIVDSPNHGKVFYVLIIDIDFIKERYGE